MHEHAAQVFALFLRDAERLLVHLERVLQVHHPLEAPCRKRAVRDRERQPAARQRLRRVDCDPVALHRGELVDIDERPEAMPAHQPMVVKVAVQQRRHLVQLVRLRVHEQLQVELRLPKRDELAGPPGGLGLGKATAQLRLPWRRLAREQIVQPARLQPL